MVHIVGGKESPYSMVARFYRVGGGQSTSEIQVHLIYREYSGYTNIKSLGSSLRGMKNVCYRKAWTKMTGTGNGYISGSICQAAFNSFGFKLITINEAAKGSTRRLKTTIIR